MPGSAANLALLSPVRTFSPAKKHSGADNPTKIGGAMLLGSYFSFTLSGYFNHHSAALAHSNVALHKSDLVPR